MRKFQDLQIWVRSVNLATSVYKLTSSYPDEEKYGLVSQMRRCSVSVSSNIAEGAGRGSNADFKRFLEIAYGSLYELHTQLIISKNLGYVSNESSAELEQEIIEIQKMVYTFIQKLK